MNDATDVRFISFDGQAEFAVVPVAIWTRLVANARSSLVDVNGVPNVDEAGAHPLRTWRQFRRMTVATLAEAADVATSYVTHIEMRKRRGSNGVFQRMAKVLDAPAAALTADPRQAAELAQIEALRAQLDENPLAVETTLAAHDSAFVGVHPLKAWRKRRCLTTKQLAGAAGVSSSYVRLIETGKRSGTVDTFKRLAEVLNVSPEALSAEPLKIFNWGEKSRARANLRPSSSLLRDHSRSSDHRGIRVREVTSPSRLHLVADSECQDVLVQPSE